MSMRISGFASGFDIESMVSALMEVERVPLKRAQNNIHELQADLSAWGSVDSSVGALESSVEELTSYSTWQQLAATSGNEDLLTLAAEDNAAEGNYDINVTTLAQSHRIGSDAQADTTSALGLSGDFTVGGENVTVASDDTLASLRDKINTAAASMGDAERVQAVIVDTTLVLEREATGATDISLGDGTGDILETLGLLDASKAIKNELTAGKDLAATVSGVDITRSSNTGIDDVIAGVTLNLHSVGTTSFSVERDRETIKSLIESFIAEYNSTMETMENKGAADVSGSEVQAARLQGDSLLRSIQSSSRSLVTATDNSGILDADFNSLRKIGIWTTSENNRIALTDSDALDNALQNNFDEVEALFRDYDAGVLRELDNYLDTVTSTVDGSLSRRKTTIEDRIDTREDRISDMERSLSNYEDQLWNQFSAMESMIASLQQQSSFFSSFTSSGDDA